MLGSHSLVRMGQPVTWPGDRKRGRKGVGRTKGRQMPKLGRKEREIKTRGRKEEPENRKKMLQEKEEGEKNL